MHRRYLVQNRFQDEGWRNGDSYDFEAEALKEAKADSYNSALCGMSRVVDMLQGKILVTYGAGSCGVSEEDRQKKTEEELEKKRKEQAKKEAWEDMLESIDAPIPVADKDAVPNFFWFDNDIDKKLIRDIQRWYQTLTSREKEFVDELRWAAVKSHQYYESQF